MIARGDDQKMPHDQIDVQTDVVDLSRQRRPSSKEVGLLKSAQSGLALETAIGPIVLIEQGGVP